MMHGQKNIKLEFQEVKAPIFLDNRHMKVAGCQPYAPAVFTPRDILVLPIRGWVGPRAHGSVICHWKNPGDTGNRSRDLPTCGAVPWPLRYPRSLFKKMSTFLNVRSLGALTVRVTKYTKQICKDEENNSTESNFVEKVHVNLVQWYLS
jgi:hypothetical protein